MTDETSHTKRSLAQRVRERISSAVDAVKGALQFDAFARFKVGNKEIDFPVDFGSDTVWATQAQMAELFGVSKQNISTHLKNLFDNKELDRESVVKESLTTAKDGKAYATLVYNLDAILAVGFKVNSKDANEFRKWASHILKGYIQDGYALNGARLNSDPSALAQLAREVRALRTSEKNLYAQVREAFKHCAIDYDKDDPTARTFYATSQDVFHFAASEKTAVQIILERADAQKPNMGMVSLGNRTPTSADVIVAKNYCSENELRKMEIIGEAWLLYAEGMALQGKQVSMQRLLQKLRDLVALNEFPVFPGYSGGPRREQADKHAKGQLELFKRNGYLPPAHDNTRG